MLEELPTIQQLVAPVAVISANGLLCLALYNRLAAVVSRSRTLNKERFELSIRRSALKPEEAGVEVAHLEHRIHTLDELGHQLYERLHYIRDALIYLLLAVLAMLGCSLAIGLAAIAGPFGGVALGLFAIGIVVMMLGVAKAIQELRVALSPLLFEHEMIERSHTLENGEST